MSNYRKETKKLIMLLALFVGLFAVQYLYYNFNQTKEDVNLTFQYSLLDDPWTWNYYKKISIVKPTGITDEKLPAIILLHGDQSNSRIMNNLKIEYLRNGYLVALVDVGYFDLSVIFFLNATIEYLLTRSDVNSSQIGIQGHSHGAHYASLISVIRNDTIKAVVCGNYASYDYWFNDFYPYFKYYIAKNSSLPGTYYEYISQIGPLNLPFNLSSINNLLMISDTTDYAPKPDDPIEIFKNFTESLYDTPNIQYGSYSDGSARKLYLSNSILGHGTSLFLPEAVLEAVSWMNSIFEISPSKTTLFQANLNTFFSIGFIGILAVIGFYAISTFISLIPYQKLIFNSVSKRGIEKNKGEKGEIKEEEAQKEEKEKEYDDLITFSSPITSQTKKIIITTLLATSLVICFWDFLIYIIDYGLISSILISIKDLPFVLLQELGFSFNTIISKQFPFESMFIWAVGIFFLLKYVLKPVNILPKPLTHYSFKEFFECILIGFEMYAFSFIIIKYSVYNIMGPFFSQSSLINLILGIFVLYYINLSIIILFKKEPSKTGKEFIVEFLLTFIIYFILITPYFIWNDFSIWISYNATIQMITIGCIAFLNPLLRKKGIKLLSITFFDLLFYGLMFSIL